MTHSVPSVSVRYASNGSSATANAFGMRPALERTYIGRRFKNDTGRLEKLFELYTKMRGQGSGVRGQGGRGEGLS